MLNVQFVFIISSVYRFSRSLCLFQRFFNRPSQSRRIHIVVDNSNVFIGAQNKNPAVRVNVKKLARVIEKEKSLTAIKTRIVAGSTPLVGARVWKEWENCGYTCFLGERSLSNKVSF